MQIEQIYTGCLAQGAYYIESDGEVAIIDPLRETQQYVDKANKENEKIKYIFETLLFLALVLKPIMISIQQKTMRFLNWARFL